MNFQNEPSNSILFYKFLSNDASRECHILDFFTDKYATLTPFLFSTPLAQQTSGQGYFTFDISASPLFYIPNSIKLFQNTPELSRVFFPLSFLIKTVPLTVVSLDS